MTENTVAIEKDHTDSAPVALRHYMVSAHAVSQVTLLSKYRDIELLIKERASYVSPYGRKVALYKIRADDLRRIYDRCVAELPANVKMKHIWSRLNRLRIAIEKAVDNDSIETVLGIKAPEKGTARKMAVGQSVRLYMHTLDGKPAYFTGRSFELFQLHTSSMYTVPLNVQQVRREQRAVISELLRNNPSEVEPMRARMGYFSYRAAGPGTPKEE